ncbi:MAG: helix-turn-helix domain-containing protein [Candidatus Paceibacterota bacterium]
MEEITLEDKKYVSSKQAAKLTGYAKDYVGQLCREGRVQARLVGRAWYVLESSILDHRFGSPSDEVESPRVAANVQYASSLAVPIWEAPRYTPSAEQMFPQIKQPETLAATDDVVKLPEQESWSAWLETEDSGNADESPDQVSGEARAALMGEPESSLAPDLLADQAVNQEKASPRKKRMPATVATIIRAASILIVLFALSLVAINSGYFDQYMHSFNRASIITGMHTYIKQPI